MSRVAGDRHRLALLQVRDPRRAVGARARDADREQHDREVDDVAAVAAPVARHERAERVEPASSAPSALPRPRPADELDHDRREREDRERVRRRAPGRSSPRPARAARRPSTTATANGIDEARPSARSEVAPPGDERPDPHQQEQRQPEDAQEEVVVGRPDRHRLAAHGLGEQRERDPPEHGQREGDEQQVVVEEGRLARGERLEPRPRPQQRQPPEDHRDREERDQAR